MPVLLGALVDVGDVHLDDRLRISFSASTTGTQPNEKPAGLMITAASFSKASWIQSTITPSWLVWRKSQASPSSAASCSVRRLDLGQRRGAVQMRLAPAEHVEVRAVENE